MSGFIFLQDTLIDEIVVALYHVSLAPRAYARNIISVYNLEPPNEFDGRYETELTHLGMIEVQGDDGVAVKEPDVHAPRTHIMLADPEFYQKIFRFFKIEEYRIELFLQTWKESVKPTI